MVLNTLRTADLAVECSQQSDLFRRGQPHDDQYCLELFQRAIVDKDQEAWEAIYTQYWRIVVNWICKRLNCSDYAPDELTHEAFARFARAFQPKQFHLYNQLPHVMAYLQRCAYGAALDARRQTHRAACVVMSLDEPGVAEHVVSERDGVEREVLEQLNASMIWARVLAHCQTEADKVIARQVFVEGWRPEEIYQHNGVMFKNVRDVYQTLRNLRDRLRRDASLIQLDSDSARA